VAARTRTAKSAKPAIADEAEVLAALTDCMRGDIDEDAVVTQREGGSSTAMVLKKRIGARERLRAAEMLARRYGLLAAHPEPAEACEIVDDIGEGDEET
jgi:phage terminase small subunit